MLIHIRKIEKAVLSPRFMIWVIGYIMRPTTEEENRGQSFGLQASIRISILNVLP